MLANAISKFSIPAAPAMPLVASATNAQRAGGDTVRREHQDHFEAKGVTSSGARASTARTG